MMLVVYVAGKFRGANAWEIENNIRRAEDVSYLIWQAGAAALCPHSNTRYFHGSFPDQLFIDGTLALLDRCDAIFMLPGWEESAGAVGEWNWANSHGIPVFFTIDKVESWIEGQKRFAPKSLAAR